MFFKWHGALYLSENYPDEFLKLVFDDLRVYEFKFTWRADGRLDTNMISRSVKIPAQIDPRTGRPTCEKQLAIHLNCIIKASQLRNSVMTLYVTQFHLTARSVPNQNTIHAYGPSVATAATSVHLNASSSEWGRRHNLQALAAEVDVTEEQILHTLQWNTYGITSMWDLKREFKTKVGQKIRMLLSRAVNDIYWEGDGTFM